MKKILISNAKDLAYILHNSSLDAFSYPLGRGDRNLSADDWDRFRERVASELLERCVIYKKERK